MDIKKRLKRLRTALLVLLAGSGGQAYAGVFNLDYSSLDISKIQCLRDYLVPEVDCVDWRGGVALNADFSGGPVFMRNIVHGEGTEARFQTMGWKYELGLSLPGNLELFWAHHSRHILDAKVPIVTPGDGSEPAYTGKFPISDAITLRFVLFKK